MSARPIGYYVHHHGDGHLHRALALAPHMQGRIVLLGTGIAGRTGGVPAISLDEDRLPGHGFDGRDDSERPQSLHYAPIDHEGLRRRVARMAGWIAEARPALIVVDVSVEVAMLARLASVPTVVVRLSGRRDDPPHVEAFRAAAAVLAPFAVALDDPECPPWLRKKTLYAAGLVAQAHPKSPDPDRVLGVVGRGGTTVTGEDWAAAAAATPDKIWRIVGACAAPALSPANIAFAGWVPDPDREIARAGIVVGAAGDGIVGAVIAARRPFVCIPEDRPFNEQTIKADRLAMLGAAIVAPGWPRPERWPALFDAARRLDPSILATLDDPEGPRHTADRLLALADAPPVCVEET